MAVKSIRESQAAFRARRHAPHFADGPPRAAAEAVQRIHNRKANAAAVKSAISSMAVAAHAPADAATIASLAGTPFSFGGSAAFTIPTALAGAFASFVKAFVSFLYMLHLMSRDYRETKKANERLKSRDLDEGIFAVCPMLGAAYLVETRPEQRQQLMRLPVTSVDAVCAGNPEASGLLAAAAAAARRVLKLKPDSFREQVSGDLHNHIEPTIADAHQQLGGFGWVLNGPYIRVANTPPPGMVSNVKSTLVPNSAKPAPPP